VTSSALDFLFGLEQFGMKFGLDNMAALCEALGHPERAFPSVIVAGTNGKGSVTAMTEAALRAAGHRTGRYTSPHLERLEERFAVDGVTIATDRMEAAADRVREAAESLVRQRRLAALPTFFECTTAIAFELFRDAHVGIAVLEVGLGGRLDATNIVSPLAAAIVSIDFDHQRQLGNTLESIAAEKAGVIKPGIPVVCGPVPPEAFRVISDVCRERDAELISADDRQLEARVATIGLPLPGRHQRTNAAVAWRLLQTLDRRGVPVDDEAIRAGLASTEWPGRLELFEHRGARVLLDAAHNPAGARALADYVREWAPGGVTLVFGAMRDKEVDAMLEALASVTARMLCTTAPNRRSMPAAELAEAARRLGIDARAVDDPIAALERACAPGAHVVVAGSIFLIGPLRTRLRA
jgi:dihydrofolate synthase / folylpolyglutamate synthase